MKRFDLISRYKGLLTWGAVYAFAVATSCAQAATYTWNGGGGDIGWTTADNWVEGSAPGNPGNYSDIFNFNAPGAVRLTNRINGTSGGGATDDGRRLNQLNFTADADSVVHIETDRLSGGYRVLNFGGISPAITVDSGATGNHLISGAGDLYLQSSLTVTHNGSGTLTIADPIKGATGAGIIKAGTGTLILSAANTYDGGTTVNGGTLSVTGSGTLGASNVTVEAGVLLLSNTGNNMIANTAILTIADGATVDLASGINESVYRLQLGNSFAAIGTWGATGSGADNIDDDRFSGTGNINVLDAPPPPAGTVLIIK